MNSWKLYQKVLVSDLPPHVNINPTESELKFLMNSYKPYFIRWTNDFDSTRNYPFWYVIKDEKEDTTLKSYPTKIRSEIRRGLRNNKVYKIDSEYEAMEILPDLYDVYIKAFDRYKNIYITPCSLNNFRNLLKQSFQSGNELWIVKNKEDNKICAYCISNVQAYEGSVVVNYNTIKLHPSYLKYYPAYALVFEMNRYYLNERNVLYLHDGSRSLGHETNIHEWLVKKFKFRKARCKLNIFYRKDIKLLVNKIYPLKKVIYYLESRSIFTKKLAILLKHEEIRRKCEEIHIKNHQI